MVDEIDRIMDRSVDALIAALGYAVTAEQKLQIQRCVAMTAQDVVKLVKKELRL